MTGILTSCRRELSRIFSLAPVFSVLFVASMIYAVFYPQPYRNEALRNVPVAVVDQDRTPSSREFSRLVDASADVEVIGHFPDMPSAERAVFLREANGILYIPLHFERDLLHGRQSPVAVYGDASYFLMYQRVAGAVNGVAASMGASVEAARLVASNVDPVIAQAAVDPMPFTAVPLFNPEGGYATYVLPAAFALILQQLLLIASALLGTIPAPAAQPAADRPTPISTVLGKLLAYLTIEVVLLPTYLVALPYLYGLPLLGSPAAVMLFGIPFVLAVGALGMVIAAILRKPIVVQLTTAALGLPFFFLAGYSWPTEAFPGVITLLAKLVPSTSAIQGFSKITQTGATLYDVRPESTVLWCLAVFYGVIAILAEVWHRRTA